jgi:amphi-Trp domain-containing protein
MVVPMTFELTDRLHVSPQQAAECLTDIAYALVAGGPVELTVDHERVTVPLGEEVLLQRDLQSDGDRHRLALRLSWSAEPS